MTCFTQVRYGKMVLVGIFKTECPDLRAGDRCIVRTDRGKELGEVLKPPEPLPESQSPEGLGEILRRAEPADLQLAERLERESVPRARQFFREQVRRLNLPMKLVDVDYLFGGERLIFYFRSETRVDFRELVRILAREFRARIELKQVGARDAARLMGDAGHCGLFLCCRGYLKDLGGISMDMAKLQKHTADPAKITGWCGKLMCCLRGEASQYGEARRLMPPKGTRIETDRGIGWVRDYNLLLREVVLEREGGGQLKVRLEEIRGALPPVSSSPPADEPAAGGAEAPAEKPGTAPPAPVPAAPSPPSPEPAPETPPASGPPAPAPEAPPPAAPRPPRGRRPYWIAAGRREDFPPGTGRPVDLGGLVVAVFNLEGRFHILSNSCPHQGGSLGEGKVDGKVVTCPVHQWKFDIPTGKGLSVAGPCARRYAAAVVGDEVFVGI